MITNPKEYRRILIEAVTCLYQNEVVSRSLFFDSSVKIQNIGADLVPRNYREDNHMREINLSVYKTGKVKYYIVGEILEKRPNHVLLSIQAFIKSLPKTEPVARLKEFEMEVIGMLSQFNERMDRVENNILAYNFEFPKRRH